MDSCRITKGQRFTAPAALSEIRFALRFGDTHLGIRRDQRLFRRADVGAAVPAAPKASRRAR
jgi:hypothetical protein